MVTPSIGSERTFRPDLPSRPGIRGTTAFRQGVLNSAAGFMQVPRPRTRLVGDR